MTLATSGTIGARSATPASASAITSAAGASSGEWNGALTGSRIERRAPCSRGDRDRALDRAAVAADDHLAGRVVVGQGADLVMVDAGAGRLGGDGPGGFGVEPEQRRHRPAADRHGALHRLPAPLQQPRRVADSERPRRRQRRVLAERMAGDKTSVPADVEAAFGFEDADHREARRHQRRLRVLGQGQLALGTLEHQPRQMAAPAPRRLRRTKGGRRERRRRGCAPCRPPASPDPGTRTRASS